MKNFIKKCIRKFGNIANKEVMQELDKITGVQEHLSSLLLEQSKLIRRQSELITGVQNNLSSLLQEQSKSISDMQRNLFSLKFQSMMYLNHFVDMKNCMPARGGMRQIQEGRLKVLNEVVDVLERNGFDYWLHGGTLLGAVRFGFFIPWDDDIDIGIWEDDKEEIFAVLREYYKESEVYKFIDASELRAFPPGCFWKIAGKKNNYEYLDIFEFGESKKFKDAVYEKWWEESQKDEKFIKKPPLHFSRDTLFPLSTIIFEGRIFKAPHNPTRYVELNYGSYQNFPEWPYEKIIPREMNSKLKENLEEL